MTSDSELLEIGYIADMVDSSGRPNQDSQARRNAQNHLIDPFEDAAFREFLQMMQNQVAMGIDVSHALRFVLANRSKSLNFYGKVMAFFFLSFAMTYIVAFTNIFKSTDKSYKIELDLFTYIIPFVSFIIDASVKRAYQIQARSLIMCGKIFVIFFYLSFYVIALQRTSESQIYWIATINFFIFPLLMLVYWVALLKKKLS